MTYISSGEQGNYGQLPRAKRHASRSSALSHPHQQQGTKGQAKPHSKQLLIEQDASQNASQNAQQVKRYADMHTGFLDQAKSYGAQFSQQQAESGFFRFRHPHELPYRQQQATNTYRENHQMSREVGGQQGEWIRRIDYYA